MRIGIVAGLILIVAGCAATVSFSQNPDPLVETGRILVDGKSMPYLIRNLPVSSFPDLPPAVAASLNSMGCLIPQTYEAHRPENVVRASLARPGSNDWAALCAARGKVSLLIFLADSAADKPIVLIKVSETDRLQPRPGMGQLGFNWGIDPATPKRIHDAQAGMSHRLPMLDHDCLADTTVDGQTIYRLLRNGVWETVETE